MTEKEAKTRILEAATSLFARKSYAAVGVREIAEAANVNISMISYYFEGKIGILKKIIDEFHDRYYYILKDIFDEDLPPEECMISIVRTLVNFVKTNTELSMVVFGALPLDIPEITDYKAERASRIFRGMSGIFTKFGLDPDDGILISTVGPGLFSLISTHFRLRPIQKNVFGIEFDDAFYERYTEIIATLFLHGITGIAAQNQEIKEKNNENIR